MDYNDYWEEPYGLWEEPEERERDYKIDEAKKVLQTFFEKNKKDVFYMKQLEVKYEKQFFHWISARAINELIDENIVGSEMVPLQRQTQAKFIFHKSHMFKDENTNKYNEKEWKRTGHDLDFIIEKDRVAYGCEVKNKFDYIGRTELRVKLNMCRFLGVKPIFIMRNSPKSYNYEIIQRGGYAMIFDMQIYPFGYERLVKRIRDVLDMPVDCPRAIPDGIIRRFMRWHERQVSS